MGGSIKIAFRFSDGEACCFERWTNNMGILSNLSILDGDEKPVRDYIAMTRNNDYIADPHYMGRPVGFGKSEYGFVLIDYQTKTILDVNGYTSLFGNIPAMSLSLPRDGDEDDYFARWYILIRDALVSGRSVFRDTHTNEKSVRQTLSGIENLSIVEADIHDFEKRKMTISPRPPEIVLYHIDTAPFIYFSKIDNASNFKQAFALARGIGFPFTRKEGLNANYPYPRKRKVSGEEVKARYLWMKMKELEEYQSFDGVPFDELSKETVKLVFDYVNRLTDEDFRSLKFDDMIGSGKARLITSLGTQHD